MTSQIESRLLKLLKDAKEDNVSGEDLSKKLGRTRSAVWKHIESLREAGYEIAAAPRSGYKFIGAPDRLLPDEICDQLDTRIIGREVLSFETLDSTNRLALELAGKGAKEGLVIFAEEQTKGRGRLGRTWSSPKGKGLYFSVVLKPKLDLSEIPRITLSAAVALCEALKETARIEPKIRWPNDVLVQGKKISGILTEMNAESDRVHYVVVGIGLNVNTSQGHLPEGATSLKEITGKTWDRCALARAVLQKLDDFYDKLSKKGLTELAGMWERFSMLSGERVVASTHQGDLRGVAMGIDDAGALWIRQDSGIQTKILSGDVRKIR